MIRIATPVEAATFRAEHCQSASCRSSIADKFTVSVASFEQLLPDKSMISYASGGKRITRAFIMFEVIDSAADIAYYPVFSQSVGKSLLMQWGMPVPQKMKLFVTKLSAYSKALPDTETADVQSSLSLELRTLIVFSRSMMIQHCCEPQPMSRELKELYDELEKDPAHSVSPGEVKCVNKAIESFLASKTNTDNEVFSSLQDYLDTVLQKYKVRLVGHDFEGLRQLFKAAYPSQPLYF